MRWFVDVGKEFALAVQLAFRLAFPGAVLVGYATRIIAKVVHTVHQAG